MAVAVLVLDLADRIEALAAALAAGEAPVLVAGRLLELAAIAREEARARQAAVDRCQVELATTSLATLYYRDAVSGLLPLRPADCCLAGCPDRVPWPDAAAEAAARERARADRDEAERLMGGSTD